MNSNFLNINWSDVGKSLFSAFVGGLLAGLIKLMDSGHLAFDWLTFKPVLVGAVIAALAYLIKNLLTNSAGEMLTTEKSEMAIKLKNGGKLIKILIIGLLLSGAGLISSAQNKFFAPVKKDYFTNQKYFYKSSLSPEKWLKRPFMQMTGVQFEYIKDESKWQGQGFKSMALGAAIEHFSEANGSPYTDYGFTGFVLINVSGNGTILKPGIGIEILQFGSFGVAYDPKPAKTFIEHLIPMMGISYSFN